MKTPKSKGLRIERFQASFVWNWTFCFFAVCNLLLFGFKAVAEDLTLRNGTVYHVIEVHGSNGSEILIDILDNGLSREVWVPLSLLAPEQLASLMDFKKKDDAERKQAYDARAIKDKVKSSECLLTGRIVSFADKGVLADASLIDIVKLSPVGEILQYKQHPAQVVYISGTIGNAVASGDRFETISVYPIGIFEQVDQRYRAYTSDYDLAVKYWIKSQHPQDADNESPNASGTNNGLLNRLGNDLKTLWNR